VEVYTDGSYQSADGSSAWAVAVRDQWFDLNYRSLPVDEQLLRPSDLIGSTLIGAAIRCTTGVYPAELQAIARALAALPLSFRVTVHSDSAASIAALTSFLSQPNERKRLRMSARPLLLLIERLLQRRADCTDTAVQFLHVRAHTDGGDADSVGNRLADFQAERARLKPDVSAPLSLRPLAVEEWEPHLHIRRQDPSGNPLPDGLVIDDPRRTALRQLQAQALAKWHGQVGAARDVCATRGMIDLGRVAMRLGSAEHQATLVHVATDSVDFHIGPSADGSKLQRLRCSSCGGCEFRLLHLSDCPSAAARAHRSRLQSDLVRLLSECAESRSWLSGLAPPPCDLLALLRLLFPPPASATAPEQLTSHFARCQVGALTLAELRAASRLLGFESARDGLAVLHRVQLAFLARIHTFYSQKKSQ
jgi:ribonuclease HI